MSKRIAKFKFRDNYAPLVASLIIGCGVFLFFLLVLPYHLQYKEQSILFLNDSAYIFSRVGRPGWLATVIGDFFTQFYWFKLGGPTVIALALVVLWWAAFHSFRDIGSNISWAMIFSTLVIIWEWLRETDPVYPLSGTIALIGAFLLFMLFNVVREEYASYFTGIVLVALAYWAFAYGAWVLLVMILIKLALNNKWWVVLGFALLGFLIPFSLFPATNLGYWPNKHYERLLAIETHAYHDDWESLGKMIDKYNEGGVESIYRNLYFSRNNELDKALMNQSLTDEDALIPYLTFQTSNLALDGAAQIWMTLGDMNMAEYCTELAMMTSPNGVSSKHIRRLAQIAYLNQDTVLADKYLDLLEHTLIHKNWAQKLRNQDMADPLLQRLNEIRGFMSVNDTLRDVNDAKTSLRHLLKSNPDNTMAYQYLIAYDLLSRDLSAFQTDYQKRDSNNRLCEEALVLSSILEGKNKAEIEANGINPSLIDEYDKFVENYNNKNDEELMIKFGNSYWYYYWRMK